MRALFTVCMCLVFLKKKIKEMQQSSVDNQNPCCQWPFIKNKYIISQILCPPLKLILEPKKMNNSWLNLMLKQMILAKENEIYRVILTASVCQRAKIRRFLHQLTTQSINTLLGVQRIKAEIKLPTYEQPTSTCYLDSASSLDLLASFMTFAAFCAILTVPHLTRGLSAGLGEGRDRRFPPDIRINNSR